MAITLTLTPDDSFVAAGEPVHFILNVANSDGATRVVDQITFRGEQLQVAGALSVPMLSDVNNTIVDSASANYSLSGVFFANAVPGGESQSITTNVLCEVTMKDTSDVITSVVESDTVSMSVVPSLPNVLNPLTDSFPALNFQSNRNAIYMLLPLV